jgi:excisionase family DNA binding protein
MREPLLTIAEVCELLSLGEWNVRRLIKTGAIPSIRIGTSWRVAPEALRRVYGADVLPRPDRRVTERETVDA